MRRKIVIIILLVTACILAVPLVAMQFTDEVDWSVGDFIAAGILLAGSGLMIEFVASRSGNTTYKLGVVLGVVTGLFLIWINLAVGIIGSEDNPANLMYTTVILIGIVGTTTSGFQARGMSHALFATAIAQLLVPMIAFIIMRPEVDEGLFKVVVLNTNIAVLFAGSGLLFRRASLA